MAGAPGFKVYNPAGEYVASCKHGEDAALLVSGYGDGAKIKWDHRKVLWQEGAESQPAAESFDFVASVLTERMGWK